MWKLLRWLGFTPYKPFTKAKASDILKEAKELLEEGWERKHPYWGIDEDTLGRTYTLAGAVYMACKDTTGDTGDSPYLMKSLAKASMRYYWGGMSGMSSREVERIVIEFDREAKTLETVLELLNGVIRSYEAVETVAELDAAQDAMVKELLGDDLKGPKYEDD